MSLWAVKDAGGNWQRDNHCDIEIAETLEDAQMLADYESSQPVELVEKPAPIVVSQEEAKKLTEAKTATYPAEYITRHSCLKQGVEDRLMRAYTIGWTVEKPKHFVLPMPGTEYHNGSMHGMAQYYAVKGTSNWRPDAIALGTDDAVEHGYTVTQADIDAAPNWVKSIKPVEVTDDEQ